MEDLIYNGCNVARRPEYEIPVLNQFHPTARPNIDVGQQDEFRRYGVADHAGLSQANATRSRKFDTFGAGCATTRPADFTTAAMMFERRDRIYFHGLGACRFAPFTDLPHVDVEPR